VFDDQGDDFVGAGFRCWVHGVFFPPGELSDEASLAATGDSELDVCAVWRGDLRAAYAGKLDMCALIRLLNQRSAGSLSCTPLHTIDSSAASIANGGSCARNVVPSVKAHAA